MAASGGVKHPGSTPYVVVCHGNMHANSWYRCEWATRKSPRAAVQLACQLYERYSKWTEPENRWFRWSVMDARTEQTIFEIE